MPEYVAAAEPSGRWWMLEDAQGHEVLAQISRPRRAEEIIDAIANLAGVARESITIRFDTRPYGNPRPAQGSTPQFLE